MIEFKEWAKDKVFYSTNIEYLPDPFMFDDTELFSSVYSVNGVALKEGDNYIWKNNKSPDRDKRELEGWVYKENYEKDIFKYQSPDMWNPIPNEYKNIKIKQ